MLTRDDLLALEWRFSGNGHTASEHMRLLPGGRIAGYRHPNEYFWAFEDGRLTLLNSGRGLTAALDLASAPGEPPRFEGPYAHDASIRFELTGHAPLPWPEPENATRRVLSAQVAEHGWSVGAHSYGAPAVFEAGYAKLNIGRYCSISAEVTVALADHKTSNVSSYPFMSLRSHWPSAPFEGVDHVTRGDVNIGADVWIGAGAFIGSGVTIGDGAVIGARSVVTRDVPAYAVVLGAPARVVRQRFEPQVVAALLALRWWDWPELWVDAITPLLLSERCDDFVRLAARKPESLEALVAFVDEVVAPPPPQPPSLAARIAARLRR